ncbi:NUDIX hydrolase [Streptococcus porcinus]|uniref:hypothetical protein n=1 Tax=Streptococcus porcinus TaxID=1340 RepID=UPI0010CACEC8|nr:hypothetical protein [Streptococcus porcinus]VTS27848.1 NUDIX hydrolase [Streptococcus porcinus]
MTLGGSALSGETAQQAAMREVKFDDTFLVVENINLEDIHFTDKEVQAVEWASYSDICQMIEHGTFITYFDSKIRMCFEIRGQFDAHKHRH